MRLIACNASAHHGHYVESEGCPYCLPPTTTAKTQKVPGFTRKDVRHWLRGAVTLLETDVRWLAQEVFKGECSYWETDSSGDSTCVCESPMGEMSCYGETQRARRDMVLRLIHRMPEDQ